MKRIITSLNFDWFFRPDFKEEALLPDFEETTFTRVDIPHTCKELPLNNFDEKDYQFVSSYRKHFSYSRKKETNRVFLYFAGVAMYCRVYLNGSFIGENKCGYNEFNFDITDFLVEGDNLLALMVDSTERNEIPPFGNIVDYLCYGGIYREVWLEERAEKYVKDVFIRTKNVAGGDTYIDADIEMSAETEEKVSLSLLKDGNTVKTKDFAFSGRKMKIKWRTPGVEPWSLENPALYTLRVRTDDDEKSYTFGFRECVFRKNGFFLNGKRVKIRGLNRHQSYPYAGYAMPASAQRADADFLKYTLGVNFVRTSHYMDSRHFIERCNEIGLLVFTEIPSWQHIGEGEWRENFLRSVESMILRDRNDPCVVLWGVRVNESPDCDELYKASNELAHSLDDTRQTGGVRAIPRSHLFEDVYTYNDFIHDGGNKALLNPDLVAGNAPYLVTEHNGHMYPTKSFDREEIRCEQALRHARVLDKAFSSDRYCGAVGWCMADYNTHRDFGSGDKICYHGVADMFRIPKTAGYFYASQQSERPVLRLSSTMDIGEHPACRMGRIYAFTNCDCVKVYKNGFYVSTAYPDRKHFPNLPHPPVEINDFIGDSLINSDGINSVSSSLLKPFLSAVGRESWHVPFYYYVPAALGVISSGKKPGDIIPIITKYVTNWGSSRNTYRFDGYMGDDKVISVPLSSVTETRISVKADKTVLREGFTYDAARVEITCLDQNGNVLPFAHNGVSIRTTGPVEIIGPKEVSLIGGGRAFWVRSKGESGRATVKIAVENAGIHFIYFDVYKDQP